MAAREQQLGQDGCSLFSKEVSIEEKRCPLRVALLNLLEGFPYGPSECRLHRVPDERALRLLSRSCLIYNVSENLLADEWDKPIWSHLSCPLSQESALKINEIERIVST